MEDKNMKEILEKWGFKSVDANGRIIGDPKKQRRIATRDGGLQLRTTTDNPKEKSNE